jgi:hypothetical protein
MASTEPPARLVADEGSWSGEEARARRRAAARGVSPFVQPWITVERALQQVSDHAQLRPKWFGRSYHAINSGSYGVGRFGLGDRIVSDEQA